DPTKKSKTHDSRGKPWLWFYEDFLAKFDPEARKEAGVYYTPVDVVQCQVRLTDHILREVFGKPLSFGDRSVVTLEAFMPQRIQTHANCVLSARLVHSQS